MENSQRSLELDVEVNADGGVTLPADVVRRRDVKPGARLNVRITARALSALLTRRGGE